VSEGPFSSLNLGERTGDDPRAVGENLARVAGMVGARLARCAQVHGRDVVRQTELPDGARPKADGIATNVPGVAALVLTADCLPVALHAPGAVAMVHAGWIGPGAGGCCYEVGDEVRGAFADVPEAHTGRNIDLKAVTRARLQVAGVADVHDAGICTMCDERFFSHRRDRGTTGRQGGAAWLA
jgi:copper oxidase (laccase) domain-containing protein